MGMIIVSKQDGQTTKFYDAEFSNFEKEHDPFAKQNFKRNYGVLINGNRPATFECRIKNINIKLLYSLMVGEPTNNYRKLHNNPIIRQKAYDKNYKNRKANRE